VRSERWEKTALKPSHFQHHTSHQLIEIYDYEKFVSLVLTTGLLTGTVAFGALACGQNGNFSNKPKTKSKWDSMEVISRHWAAASTETGDGES
jgi:hypothetical protein